MPPKKRATEVKASTMAALRTQLTKRYGTAVVRREEVVKYEVIPTGSFTLDLATRVGGWVRGRIHEILGPEGCGKTTLAILSMIEAQQKYPDLAAGYIDMEQTFDYDWAESLGLDTSDERFLHLFPDDSEDVSDMLKDQAQSGLFSIIVVDSIGGMESKQAFEKDAGESAMGRNAQVISRMVKNCAVLCRKHDVATILINQPRANFSNPNASDISAGPKAMRHSTTMKVDMRLAPGDPIKYLLPGDKEPVVIGRQIRARVIRNKVGVQGKAAEYYLFNADTPEYGPVGIDRADEAVNIGLFTGVIQQTSSWYSFFDMKFQGQDAVKAHLRSCPDDLARIREESIRAMSHEVITEVEVQFDHADENEGEMSNDG